jgi:uncharacterized protein YidB (DUF937 family)
MGLLDDLLAGAAGAQGMGGESTGDARASARPQMSPGAGGGGPSILMALLPVVLSMLASRGGGVPAPQTGGGGGGGLGDILGQMLGGAQLRGGGSDVFAGGGAGGGLGGLGALLESLQRAGYGDQARSWVGSGANSPIPPEAIEQVFGRGGLAEIARQTGISEAEASQGLSQLLPEVVDRVTPNGDVPDLDSLVTSVDQMSRRYGFS